MTRKQIAKRSLERKLKKRDQQFDRLWAKIVTDVNDYIDKHGQLSEYDVYYGTSEKLIDNLCLSGAWIQDRLLGKKGVTHSPTYKKSLTKKIRKALGYNL
mgnify:CR=1 FL=1